MRNATYTLLFLIAVVFVLVQTKSLLLPFIIALLIWYLIKDIRDFLTKNQFVRNRFPLWLQNTTVFAIIFGVLSVVSRLLAGSIESFMTAIPNYEANVQTINAQIKADFGFDLLQTIQDLSINFDFTQFVQPVMNSITGVLGDGFMIILYVIFMLLEESTFGLKYRLFFRGDEEEYEESKALLTEIDKSFGSYISIKTFTSFLTGLLSYLLLLLLGVDTPMLWAFLIFLLNYIPSIGSLIATVFPTVIALLQTGSLLDGLWVLLGVGVIQVLIGNFLEPRLMGNTLNISPLVVLLALIAWGAIWGVMGMVLSVPIMVMLIIVFSKFEGTRGVAVLLSENGRVG